MFDSKKNQVPEPNFRASYAALVDSAGLEHLITPDMIDEMFAALNGDSDFSLQGPLIRQRQNDAAAQVLTKSPPLG